jgi:branched-subunit amino acid aminotransferase/4-amino-4-deoxychorismate lyase
MFYIETPATAQLVPEDSPHILATDRGFTYGDGLYETVRILNSVPLFLDRHLARLSTGLAVLNLSIPWDAAALTVRCRQLIATNQITNGILRLTISRGPASRGFDLPVESNPTLIIQTISRLPSTPASRFHAILIPWNIDPANPLCQLKSLNALDKILAKQYAHQHHADDAIFLNIDDCLAEATSSNLFFVHINQIMTPSLSCGILPGIIRQLLIETAPALGHQVSEVKAIYPILKNSTEAFLTNTVVGVQPLTHFNHQPIGSGQPGPITNLFSKHYAQLCQSQSSNPPIL